MVVFTCNNCGESVQKPKVDKHINVVCRKRNHAGVSLTCVDCFKDFDENYQEHTKCITEDERYSAKGYQAKASSNKGERKQQQWIDNIQAILNREQKLTHPQKKLLEYLTNHENVPRKKPKFMNFIKNVRVPCSINEAGNVFDLLEAEFKKNASNGSAKTNGCDTVTNGTNGTKETNSENNTKRKNDDESTVGEKKKKGEDITANGNTKTEGVDVENQPADEFKWKKTIMKIVKDKQQIKRKKLLKKLIKTYKELHANVSLPDNISEIFDEKLMRMTKIEVESDVVRLK